VVPVFRVQPDRRVGFDPLEEVWPAVAQRLDEGALEGLLQLEAEDCRFLSVRTPRTLPPERTIRTSASVSEKRLAALISGSSASIVTKSLRITSTTLGTADATNPFPQRRSLISNMKLTSGRFCVPRGVTEPIDAVKR
jgi:hypothetical protein